MRAEVMGEIHKKAGERSKPGQKLNMKVESQERRLKVSRAKDRRAKGTFFPGPGILHAARKGRRKKKKQERKRSLPPVRFFSHNVFIQNEQTIK